MTEPAPEPAQPAEPEASASQPVPPEPTVVNPGGQAEPDEPGPPEIPVADQRAAGVPPEETVTLAEQRQGTPPPDAAIEAADPSAGVEQVPDGTPSQAELQAGGGTSNENIPLPPVLPTAAAKAHAMLATVLDESKAPARPENFLQRVLAIVELAHRELDRFVPTSLRHAAGVEAGQVLSRDL